MLRSPPDADATPQTFAYLMVRGKQRCWGVGGGLQNAQACRNETLKRVTPRGGDLVQGALWRGEDADDGLKDGGQERQQGAG